MLYEGDSVRLLRQLPDLALPEDTEGSVTGIHRDAEGVPRGAIVCFHHSGSSTTATVPMDALELVISSPGGCTAVFWALENPSEAVVEGAMHAIMDYGHEMRQGSNVQRLCYDAREKFWRREERLTDPTGATVATSAPTWDGCVVAFSGRQRYHLDFRLGGPKAPYVLLHQRFETCNEQQRRTPDAMSLLRLVLSIYSGVGAAYAALPVAGHWLMDESWPSLLTPPYYPDLFLLPQIALPAELPPLFRSAHLANDRAVLTSLPVKFSPQENSREVSEHDLMLSRLRACKAVGEKAYDQLYDAHSSGSATGLYSDAKEAFYDAIHLANQLGLAQESRELQKRLEHIKAVFRSQFS